jgi:hypothetical protein
MLRKNLVLVAVSAPLVALAACAPKPALEPIRVSARNLGPIDEARVRAGHPIIIEVQAGDVVPLDVTIGGDLVEAPRGTVIPLTAKRTFWVRVSKEGLAVSRDGEHFGVKPRTPGSFRAGVSATRARGVRAEVVVTTPRP